MTYDRKMLPILLVPRHMKRFSIFQIAWFIVLDALGPPPWLGPAAARGDKASDELLSTHMGDVCFRSLGTSEYCLQNLPKHLSFKI